MSGASEQANGQASGPVLTSRFLAILNYCALQHFTSVCIFQIRFVSRCTCFRFTASLCRLQWTGRCSITRRNLPSSFAATRSSSNSTTDSSRLSRSPRSLNCPANSSLDVRRYEVSLFLSLTISLFLYFSLSLFLSFTISVFDYFCLSLFLLFSTSAILYFCHSLFLSFSSSVNHHFCHSFYLFFTF